MTTFSLAAEAVQFLNVCQIANPEGGGLTDFGSSSYLVVLCVRPATRRAT